MLSLNHFGADFLQTDESTPLPAFQWAKNVVLVLGHEQTGIPVSILQVRDGPALCMIYLRGSPFTHAGWNSATDAGLCSLGTG